jgi:hypothetical protein
MTGGAPQKRVPGDDVWRGLSAAARPPCNSGSQSQNDSMRRRLACMVVLFRAGEAARLEGAKVMPTLYVASPCPPAGTSRVQTSIRLSGAGGAGRPRLDGLTLQKLACVCRACFDAEGGEPDCRPEP